jgi:tRNA threonylcarbamoyladenosine biosynthesis protein TsaE
MPTNPTAPALHDPATLGPGLPGPVLEAPVPTAEAMKEFGRRLGARLRAGDLVVLTGDLGAGKTTLTQGVGEGLGVRGPITSPTFVIARVHPSVVGGAPLVHVDAYRLGSLDELDDLDLDAAVAESVTVVEWGEGKAEVLTDDRLDVVLTREHAEDVDEPGDPDVRWVVVRGIGTRWTDDDLAGLI